MPIALRGQAALQLFYKMILATVVIVYTLFGGLYSVAYTDVIQLGFIFIGLWIAIPFAMKHKGVVSITSTWPEWHGRMDKSQIVEWIDSMLLLIFGGIPWQVSSHNDYTYRTLCRHSLTNSYS